MCKTPDIPSIRLRDFAYFLGPNKRDAIARPSRRLSKQMLYLAKNLKNTNLAWIIIRYPGNKHYHTTESKTHPHPVQHDRCGRPEHHRAHDCRAHRDRHSQGGDRSCPRGQQDANEGRYRQDDRRRDSRPGLTPDDSPSVALMNLSGCEPSNDDGGALRERGRGFGQFKDV